MPAEIPAGILNEADKICDIADVSGYFVALTKEEYGWGSNMVVLNRAMILAVAHLLTGEARYQKWHRRRWTIFLV